MFLNTFAHRDRPPDTDEEGFRLRALTDCTVCLGALKLVSIMCSIVLFVLVLVNSNGGAWAIALLTFIFVAAFFKIILGVLLIVGAMYRDDIMLTVALCLCFVLAFWDTITGLLGFFYYVRAGPYVVYYVLAFIFTLLVFSFCEIMCHDAVVIYSLIVSLNNNNYGHLPRHIPDPVLRPIPDPVLRPIPDPVLRPIPDPVPRPVTQNYFVGGTERFSPNSGKSQMEVCLDINDTARTDLIQNILNQESSMSCPDTNINSEMYKTDSSIINNENVFNPSATPGIKQTISNTSTTNTVTDIV